MVRQPYSVAVLSTGGRLHPRFLRFLSPTRGTEGVVKTIEERLGEKGGAFLNGKEGRVGFRKMPSLMVKKDGMILELLIKEQKLKQNQ